ncbi:MAG: TetR/AcrR family transcriptional regulator [Clostridia bacterium]|nr:TetR/AcrR family transcriptional regulator [Clostridia bacterium]
MNKSGKVDLREQKTKKALLSALYTMLEKKHYSTITISDLVQLANVSRGTFYFHYCDINDFIAKVVNEELENIQRDIYAAVRERSSPDASAFDQMFLRMQIYYEKIFERSHFYDIMYGPNVSPQAVELIRIAGVDLMYNDYVPLLMREMHIPALPEDVRSTLNPLSIAVEYLVAGQTSVTKAYITHRFNYQTKDLAWQISNLTYSVLTSSLKIMASQ